MTTPPDTLLPVEVVDYIQEHLGLRRFSSYTRSITGGDISQAFRLELRAGSQLKEIFFVKRNHSDFERHFQVEYEGLQAIAATKTIRCPQPLLRGICGHSSFLVMDWLELEKKGDFARLAMKLADFHEHNNPFHGLRGNAFVGASLQKNTSETNGGIFFIRHRLRPQITRALQNGFESKAGETLLRLLPEIQDFLGEPRAVAIHGDLWSGNFGFCRGEPVIFDPAFHYGDNEADIAMTELFGGFDQEFYRTYHRRKPASPNYAVKKDIYNLYHIIRHFNLFGQIYATAAYSLIATVARSIRR